MAFAATATALGAALFPFALNRATDGLVFIAPGAGGPAALAPALRLTVQTAGPALLSAGALLPAVVAAAGATRAAPPAALLGRLLAANTLGAIAGALCAPYVLLAWLTPWVACAAVALAYAGVAACIPLAPRRVRLLRDAVLAAGWVALLGLARPTALPLVHLAAGESLRSATSGPAGLVAVVARGDDLLIRTDNHYSLAGTADRVHQERQGLVAHLLHPEARRVAWIGSATGISAGPLAALPLEELALIEITPGVAEAAAHFFQHANRGVHMHRTTRVVQDDARNFFRSTQARFDLVVGDLFVPWQAGTGGLYSREHFRAVRERLLPDGVFVQWLPLYQLDAASFASVVATFLDEFPRVALFRGDFFARFPIVALVGFTGRVPQPEAIARAAGALGARGEIDRWVADPETVFALYAGPLGPLRESLAATPRNDDDRPRVEFGAARSGLGATPESAFIGPRLVHFTAMLRAASQRAGDDIFPALPEPARRASRAGALLQAASAAWAEGRADDAAKLLAAAADQLPARILDPERPDPTAAEVWTQRR
jgi:spermidine synthase